MLEVWIPEPALFFSLLQSGNTKDFSWPPKEKSLVLFIGVECSTGRIQNQRSYTQPLNSITSQHYQKLTWFFAGARAYRW